jgi:hypothetical protein
MSYDFRNKINEVADDKLFLSSVTFWEFEGNSDKMVKIIDHIFKPDGTFLVVERDLINNLQTDRASKNKIDVSANWEAYPEFGNYDSIIRKYR